MSDENSPDQSSKNDQTPGGRKREKPSLPPCAICAEKASGLHYGVNSCEACKVNFELPYCSMFLVLLKDSHASIDSFPFDKIPIILLILKFLFLTIIWSTNTVS